MEKKQKVMIEWSCGYFKEKHSRNSECIGTKVEVCLTFSKKQEGAKVARLKKKGDRRLGDKIREDIGSPIFKIF